MPSPYGYPGTISATGGQLFSFTSGYFTTGRLDNLTVTFEGFTAADFGADLTAALGHPGLGHLGVAAARRRKAA